MNKTIETAIRQRRVRIATIAILGASLLLLAACQAKTSNQLTVTTSPVKQGVLTKTVTFYGVFAPDQTVNVVSALVGRAVKVTAQVGDRVKKGQLLVQIDTRQLQAQLAAAKAAVQSVQDQATQAKLGIETAKANLELAQKTYKRIDALYKSQAASKNQFDDAQNKLTLSQSAYQHAEQQYSLLTGSSLAQAKAQLDLIEVQLSNSMVTSPLSGVVTNRNVNPGEMVGMSAPVMTVADTSTLKLQGTVSQDVVPLLAVGKHVAIAVDGMPNASFGGTVTQVGPIAASTGQYFPVVVSVKNDGKLLAGMTAMASFSVRSPEGLLVPSTAVQRNGEDFYVYVVKGGSVTRKKVIIGLQNSSDTAVSSGLTADEEVATSNVGLLTNGAAVTVVKE